MISELIDGSSEVGPCGSQMEVIWVPNKNFRTFEDTTKIVDVEW